MSSGNHLVDQYERDMDRQESRGDRYCSDCKCSPCECDEIYEQSREAKEEREQHGK
jgi:hypothetical protein